MTRITTVSLEDYFLFRGFRPQAPLIRTAQSDQ